MDYRIAVIRIFVTDWDAALTFYRDTVGFALRFNDPEMGWAQFDLGGCDLAIERLATDDPESPGLVGRFAGLSIEVPDIEAAYQALVKRGVTFHGPPLRQPWGGTLAHFSDPEGKILTLLG